MLSPRSIDARRTRVVALVDALPLAKTIPMGDHLSLEVAGRRFAWFLVDHHGDDRISLVAKAAAGVCRMLVHADPQCFHLPPYVGNRGWVGMWLDRPAPDWKQVAGIITDAYQLTAPKRRTVKPAR